MNKLLRIILLLSVSITTLSALAQPKLQFRDRWYGGVEFAYDLLAMDVGDDFNPDNQFFFDRDFERYKVRTIGLYGFGGLYIHHPKLTLGGGTGLSWIGTPSMVYVPVFAESRWFFFENRRGVEYFLHGRSGVPVLTFGKNSLESGSLLVTTSLGVRMPISDLFLMFSLNYNYTNIQYIHRDIPIDFRRHTIGLSMSFMF